MQPFLEDWRSLIQQAGHDPDSLEILSADNGSSDFNNHTYLVQLPRPGSWGSYSLALLHRDRNATAFIERADPTCFDLAPPTIEIDTPACWDSLLDGAESLHDTLKPVEITGQLEATIRSMLA